jgi:hypothetical protein
VISTVSVYFQLHSEGVFHDQHRSMTAVVERDSSNKIAFVYRKVD